MRKLLLLLMMLIVISMAYADWTDFSDRLADKPAQNDSIEAQNLRQTLAEGITGRAKPQELAPEARQLKKSLIEGITGTAPAEAPVVQPEISKQPEMETSGAWLSGIAKGLAGWVGEKFNAGKQAISGLLNERHYAKIKDHAGKLNETQIMFYSENKLVKSPVENETYHVEIGPINEKLQKIVLQEMLFTENSTLGLGIDSIAPDSISFGDKKTVAVFAIDTSLLNFTQGEATILATGKELLKCRDWNFTEQRCRGYWTKIMDIVPGTNYTINITPEDPGYAEIQITRAWHLDTNREVLTDIFDEVHEQDGNWSEPIYEGEYARVMFEANLSEKSSLRIYARNNQSANTSIEVYYFNSTEKIAEFPVITEQGYYTASLAGMSGSHDLFDLKITNTDPETAFLEIDHIIDPILSCPVTINASETLTQNIASTTTCITIGADNILLDCAGFQIQYGSGAGSNVYGVYAKNHSNITITGCEIGDTNVAGTDGYGILFLAVNNSLIINNTIKTNGTSNNHGIYFQHNTSNNTIANNTIFAKGTASNNFGIYLYPSLGTNSLEAVNNLIENNTINATSGSQYAHGIYLNNYAQNNTINNNTIKTHATSGYAYGMRFEASANNNTISNNVMTTSPGTGSNNNGIYLYNVVSGNSIVNNIITVSSSTAYGIYASTTVQNLTIANNTITIRNTGPSSYGVSITPSGINNFIDNNTINVSGTSGNTGIYLLTTAINNTVTNNNIYVNGSTYNNYGIYLANAANYNVISGNTIRTNGTYQNYGIFVFNPATYNNITNNTITTVNSTGYGNHGIYLSTCDNSTISDNNITTPGLDSYGIYIYYSQNETLTGNNITTQSDGLTFEGSQYIHFATHTIETTNTINGSAIMHYGGYGNSPACPDNTILDNPSNAHIDFIRCTNVTLTNFNAMEPVTLAGTANSTISYSTFINNWQGIQLFFNSTGNTITNNNITSGNTTRTGNYAIWVYDARNNTITNNNLSTKNPATATNYVLYMLANSSQNNITNNIISSNGTNDNYGVYVTRDSNNNRIANNTIKTRGSAGNNFGIELYLSSSGATVNNNTIITNGTTLNHGIYAYTYSSNNTIENNTIICGGAGNGVSCIYFSTNVYNNTISNNKVTVPMPAYSSHYGMQITISAAFNKIRNNTVFVNGTTVNGIYLYSYAHNNTIANNNVTTQGTSTASYGIYVYSNALNNIIDNNTVNTSGTGTAYGIYLSTTANNVTVRNNVITTNNGAGIYLLSSSYALVSGNRITTNGTSANYGIGLFTTPLINVTNNSILTSTGYQNYGIYLSTAAYGCKIADNNITTIGSESHGILIDDSADNTLADNNISVTNLGSSGLYVTATNYTHFTSQAVETTNSVNGSFMYYYGGAGNSPACPNNGNTAANAGHVDLIRCNNVTINNYNAIDPVTLLFTTNSTLNNSQITYAPAGVRLFYNNSGNTISNNNITAGNTTSAAGIAIQLQFINHNNTITNNNISTVGRAIASNYAIYLLNNASDNNITNNIISTNGTTTNYGIYLTLSASDNLIQNNSIKTTGTATNNYGLYLYTRVSGNIINNNSISTYGTTSNHGITLESFSSNNTISNNTIIANGTGTDYGLYLTTAAYNNTIISNRIYTAPYTAANNYGIYLYSAVSFNTARNNTIVANSSTGGHAIYLSTYAQNNTLDSNAVSVLSSSGSAYGVYLYNYAHNNTIENNSVSTFGTTANNYGIFLYSTVHNNTVRNNTVWTNGSSSSNYGIWLTLTTMNNLIDSNTVVTNGTSTNHGLYFQSLTSQNYIYNNNITTKGATSYAIAFSASSANFFNNTLLNNCTEWISTDATSANNFSNTTFASEFGAISILPTIQINGSQIQKIRTNVTNNRSYLNSANLTFFNTTGIIRLSGLGLNNPVLMVDWEDDGTYANCPADVCTLLSSAGNDVVFNVSQFTSYALTEGELLYNFSNISITKTDNPDPANASENLTYQINVTSSGNGTAYNVTVNDTYPNEVIYLTSQPDPVSGTNNTWILGNLSVGTNISINITVLVFNLSNGTVINNTVNATWQNETSGLFSITTTENTTVIIPSRLPNIAAAILNTTNPQLNDTNENLTLYIINTSDPDNNVVQNITDWQIWQNNAFASIALLNMPFETNTSSSTTTGIVKDYSTNTNNGTPLGGTYWNNSGKVGGAYVFDGIDDFINVSTLSLNSIDQFSVSAWVFITNITTEHNIVYTNNESGVGYQFRMTYWTNKRMYAYINNGSGTYMGSSGGTVTENAWNHFAFVSNNSGTAYGYLDGVQVLSFAKTYSMGIFPNSYVAIGAAAIAGGTGSAPVNGTIDEVMIFNRSLSAQQVYQLYLDGNNSRRMMTIVPPETKAGDIWQACATPNNNLTDGNTICSNNVTINALLNFSNISITKTDYPDPVNLSTNLTYQINVSNTGNGTTHNVTVNDTYPNEVIYLTSTPTPLTGTNNTWILGNLTQGTNISINITVLVLNVSNNTVINNTANATWQNETSGLFSAIATQNTTTFNPPVLNFSNISITKTSYPDPVNASTNLTYQINVTSNGNTTAFNVTVNDTYPNEVIYLTSTPTPLTGTNNTWILGNLTVGTNISINITVLVLNISHNSYINNTANGTLQNETSDIVSTNASTSTRVKNPQGLTCNSCANCTACASGGNTCTLTQSITSTGTCITIGGDETVIDCDGYNIDFDTDNTTPTPEQGVIAEQRTGVTIQNCNITHVKGMVNATGILFNGTTDSRILYNNISVNGSWSPVSIYLAQATGIIIENNTIKGGLESLPLRGSTISYLNFTNNNITSSITAIYVQSANSLFNYNTLSSSGLSAIHVEYMGIWLAGYMGVGSGSVTNNAIYENNITHTGGNGAQGVYLLGATNNVIDNNTISIDETHEGSTGIVTYNLVNSTIISGNTILINGSSTARGIYLLESAERNTMQNNKVIVKCTQESCQGIALTTGQTLKVSENTVSNNSISVEGTLNNSGIYAVYADNNNYNFNSIKVSGISSYAIYLNGTDSTFTSNTLNDTQIWIYLTDDATNNNFVNTTFAMPNGNIRFPGTFTPPVSSSTSRPFLNVSHNRAYLKSTTYTYLNISAQITFNTVNLVSPAPIADFADTGTFVNCPEVICVKKSYANNIYVLNVTGFTTYSLGGTALTKLDSQDPVNVSAYLNYTIIVNITGGNASNISLTDTYPNEIIYISAQPTPLAGTNNTWILGNLTIGQAFIVNITTLVLNITNGSVINNTANISFQNETGGIIAINVTENTTVLVPPINITLVKTDNPDPVRVNTYLNYTINISIASDDPKNITLTDIYPAEVVYDSAQPTPLAGTNDTWILGNLSAGQSVSINISVLVNIINNGTTINNTANITYQNSTSDSFTQNITISTVVFDPGPPYINLTGCAVLNSSAILVNSIQSTGTCIIVNASNIYVDCAGNNINYSTSGGNYANGISVDDKTNITITGCTIWDKSATGSIEYGINFTNTSNSLLINSTIKTNSSNNADGIYIISGSANVTITNNTFNSWSTGGSTYAIYGSTSLTNTLIANNTITANSTGGANNFGIVMTGFVQNATITNNTISASGGGFGYAILIQSTSNYCNITNNNIFVDRGNLNYAVYLQNSVFLQVLNNIVRASGTSEIRGIFNTNGQNLTVAGNTIITTATSGSLGIYILNAGNNLIENNTVSVNGTSAVLGIDSSGSDYLVINNNSVNVNGTSTGCYGIALREETYNSTITLNNVLVNSSTTSSASSEGIYLFSSISGANISNNTITTDTKGNTNPGIYLTTNVYDNRIENNTILTLSDLSPGILLETAADNNTIHNNNINTSRMESFGIRLNGVTGNNITNNSVFSITDGLFVDGSAIEKFTTHRIVNNTINGSNITYFGGAYDSPSCPNNRVLNGEATAHIDFISCQNITLTNYQAYETIALVNATNITIQGTRSMNNFIGIRILNTTNSIVNKVNITTNATISSESYGILALNDANNNNINNSNITAKGISSNEGIHIENSSNNTITNIIALATGSTSEAGISAIRASNITINNSNFTANGTGYGLWLYLSLDNTIVNSSFAGWGSNTQGIYLQNTNNTLISNSTIRAMNGLGVAITSANNNSIIDSYIDATGTTTGTNQYGIQFTTAADNLLMNNQIYGGIGANTIQISSTRIDNTRLINNTITASTSGGHAIYCASCTMINTRIENNTISTASGSAYGFYLLAGIDINTTTIAGNTISCSGSSSNGIYLTGGAKVRDTNITNNNITITGINSQGLMISTNVINTLFDSNNVTVISGSAILDISGSSTTYNNTFSNNILNISGGGDGIELAGTITFPNLFENNSILMNTTGANRYAITITQATNQLFKNTTITMLGDNSANIRALYISLNSPSYNTFTGTTITVKNCSTGNAGIYLSSSANYNNFTNTTITLNGMTSSNNYGILIATSENNTFTNTTIFTNGTLSPNYGIFANSANNIFNKTTITVPGNNSYGINGTILNITDTLINNTAIWINGAGNFTNTTFWMPNGSVNIPGLFTTTVADKNISQKQLNITYNLAYLNSTNLTELNTTGIVTLYGISFADPKPIVDWNDDTVFEDCPADICTELDYTGGTYVFNVSHFTFYAAGEGLAYNFSNISITKTDNPDPVNASTNLSYQINVTNNGNATSHNVTVNDTYPNEVIYLTSQPDPVAGTNNTWILGNLTQGTNISINITVLVFNLSNGTVINNTANVTFQNETSQNISAIATQNTTILNECPRNITQSTTLTGNIVCPATAVFVEAENVTLDCDGYTIQYNTAGWNSSFGIAANNRKNVTVKDCFIWDTNESGMLGIAINFTNVNDSLLLNNTIQTNGTNYSYGINIMTTSNRNQILNNTIQTQGSVNYNYGIYLVSTATGNNITNNNITTNGTNDNHGIRLESNANNNLINNNLVSARGSSVYNYGIFLYNVVSGNNISNNVVSTTGTTDNYGIYLTTNAYNNTIINNTIKTNGSSDYNHGIMLNSAVSGNNITNNNITTNGTNYNIGIYLYSNSNSNTIRSNIVNTGGSAANNYGIYLTNTVSGNNITNNNITTNGTSNNYGIYLLTSANNNIVNNNLINTGGSTDSNIGIYLYSTVSGNNVTNNNVTTTGTNSNLGITIQSSANNNFINNNQIATKGSSYNNFGIYLDNAVSGNNVTNNNVTTNGTYYNYGIYLLSNANNNLINNNKVTTGGSSSNNYGIYLVSGVSGNNVSNNAVSTTGTTDNYGIRLEQFAENNTFDYDNITTLGTYSYAIKINSSNYSFFNRTILNNPVQWINISDASQNNFTNTTFWMPNGSINLPFLSQLNGTADITLNKLNITFNKAFLNSTNLSTLNTTGIITLNALTFTDPRPTVDFVDNGAFNYCPTTNCNELGYTNNIFVYNVTQFTTYSSEETPLFNLSNISITKTDNFDPVNASTNLTYQINISNNGNGTTYNVTVNDTYPNEVIYLTSQPDPVAGTNNTWILGNLTQGTNISINITVLVFNLSNGTVINNTANVTFQNETSQNISAIATQNTTVIIAGQPDLQINSSQIFFNNTNPRENENITINVTVCNIGATSADNFNVTFADGNETTGIVFANLTGFSLSATACLVANATYISVIGNRTIAVLAVAVEDSNLSNNLGIKELDVQAYTFYDGVVTGNVTLSNAANKDHFRWNHTDAGLIYFFNSNATFNFSQLQALGRNTTNGTSVDDFSDANINLNMSGFNDSIQFIWGADNSTPKFTRNIYVYSRLIQYVPVINSTNSSTFITGILWDTNDDTNSEYDLTDKEDLVFVTNINVSRNGQFANGIDYETRIPSLLRKYRTATNKTGYSVELT